MTKFYWLFGAVAVIGVGVVGYNVSSGMFGSAVSTPVEVEGLDDPARLVEMARGVTKGDPEAPITIVEFGDFQCPSCADFAQTYKPQVELGLLESGQAKFVFYDFPLVSIHPNAFLAARAARCAEDQGKFWEYHDELFRQQSRWAPMPSPANAFEDYAEALGLDAGEFAGCLNSDRHADLVTANMQLGQVMRITGTPAIVVNVKGQPTSRRTQSYSYQAIVQAIEAMTSEPGSN